MLLPAATLAASTTKDLNAAIHSNFAQWAARSALRSVGGGFPRLAGEPSPLLIAQHPHEQAKSASHLSIGSLQGSKTGQG